MNNAFMHCNHMVVRLNSNQAHVIRVLPATLPNFVARRKRDVKAGCESWTMGIFLSAAAAMWFIDLRAISR